MTERFGARPDAIDPVVAASVTSFGFVFVHPFEDGNGRLHRYLIHEQLSAAGFTPKGIILPVSAVILAHLDRYQETLESFSRQVRKRTSYDPQVPTAPATGNDAVYFRYFDATEQTSFLYDALERTVEHDLDAEISFLLGFDRAQAALSAIADWLAHSPDIFIRVVRQNDGRLSAKKRKSHASRRSWSERSTSTSIQTTSRACRRVPRRSPNGPSPLHHMQPKHWPPLKVTKVTSKHSIAGRMMGWFGQPRTPPAAGAYMKVIS